MHGEAAPTETAKDGALYGAVELWEHIFGNERGLLAICHASEAPRAFQTAFFNYPDSAASAMRFSREKAQAGRDVWFCTHLLSASRRIKENATAVRALWGDLDGGEVPEGEIAPTAVVQSSPGHFHCYWRLTDPIPPEAAELLNKKLASVIGADPSGVDVTQLLRVPDTANYKYEPSQVVGIRHLDASRTYSAGALERILPPLPESASTNEHTPQLDPGEPPVAIGSEALKVWRGEAPKLKDSGEVDRSASLVKIGRVIYDAGATRRIVVEALKERDMALGWKCYTERRDADKQYQAIASVLKNEDRNHSIPTTDNRNSHSHSRIGNMNVNETENTLRACADRLATFHTCRFSERLSGLFITH